MTDYSITLISGLTGLVSLAILSLAALRGWSQWVDLRRFEIDRHSPSHPSADTGMAHTASRIDLADLRERVRKLEAIAAGVDL